MTAAVVGLSASSSAHPRSSMGKEHTHLRGKSGQKCGKVFRLPGQPFQVRLDGEDVAAFLRRLYPVKTAAAVEAAEGISADTFRKWESAGCAPSHATTLRLLLRHGPEFLAALVPEGARRRHGARDDRGSRGDLFGRRGERGPGALLPASPRRNPAHRRRFQRRSP